MISGKMRKNFTRILPGDSGLVELSPNDLYRGRITKGINKGGKCYESTSISKKDL